MVGEAVASRIDYALPPEVALHDECVNRQPVQVAFAEELSHDAAAATGAIIGEDARRLPEVGRLGRVGTSANESNRKQKLACNKSVGDPGTSREEVEPDEGVVDGSDNQARVARSAQIALRLRS